MLLSCYINLVCSSRRLLALTHYPLCITNELLCGAHLYSLDPKLRCRCYCCCTYFLAHATAACLLHFSLSLYFSHLCLFSIKNKLAKLKGLLRVQPNGQRKDEPQRGFIAVRSYKVYTVLISLYFGFQTCVRQESSVIRHLRFHQRLSIPPHLLLTHYEIRCLLLLSPPFRYLFSTF